MGSQDICVSLLYKVKPSDEVEFPFGFWGRCSGLGFSKGLYSSLNGSKFVGDNSRAVSKNLNVIKDKLQTTKLVTLKQIHSNKCIIVNKSSASHQEADAMVSKTPDIALGILTADCVPILFFDAIDKVIGAAHAGWKGAQLGIIENTIEKMCSLGSKPENIYAMIGPCLQSPDFEVKEDFLKNFSEKYFSKINNKIHFDLVAFCSDILSEKKLNLIKVSSLSTYAFPEELFSYRYAMRHSDGVCGRNISAISMTSYFRDEQDCEVIDLITKKSL